MRRTAVLLGAGASKDAGLPLSDELTREVMRELTGRRGTADLASLLNQIVSAIIGHRGETKEDPFGPLNIERVVSSIRLLATRHQHEAAPFVRSWTPSLEDVDRQGVRTATSQTLADGLDHMIGGGFVGVDAKVSQALTDAVHEATTPAGGEIFTKLEREVVKIVAHRLKQVQTVDYLQPLAELAKDQTMLDIATLNYDLTIETFAQDAGLALSRGIDNRESGATLSWNQNGINLYKIHGSVDWWIHEGRYATKPLRVGTETLVVSEDEPTTLPRPRVAIVLGDREKLEALSITLELMYDFAVALRQCQRLIVVGYGFGDLHINRLIADWIDGDQSRLLTVLDPYWAPPSAWSVPYSTQTFPTRLAAVMAEHNQDGLRGHVVKKGTKEGLRHAIDEWPDDPVSRPIRLTVTYPDEHAALVEMQIALDDRVQTVAVQTGIPNAFADPGPTVGDLLERTLISPPPAHLMNEGLLLNRIMPGPEVHSEELSRMMPTLREGNPVAFKVANRRRARGSGPEGDLAEYNDLANFDILIIIGYASGVGRRVHTVREARLTVDT